MTDAERAVREAHKGCSQRCYQWGDFQGGWLWHQECRLKFHTAIDRAIEAVRAEAETTIYKAELERVRQEAHDAGYSKACGIWVPKVLRAKRDENEATVQCVQKELDKLGGRWSLDSAYLSQAITAIRARISKEEG